MLRNLGLNLRNLLLLEEYFWVVEQFDSTLSSVIDSTLGLRCRLSVIGTAKSSVLSWVSTSVVAHVPQDVTTHLMNHLSLHPTIRTCSSDTILRAIKELKQENISDRFWITPTTYGYDTAYCLKSHCGVRGYCRPQAGVSVQIIYKFSNERTCTRWEGRWKA